MKVMCMLLSQRNDVIICTIVHVLKVVKTKGQSMMLIFWIGTYILIILVCIAMVAYYLIVPLKTYLTYVKEHLEISKYIAG